ncbi:DUF6328 family protein [Nocardia blacklockiae]|uniref:DUF6328 family protein n=1 Tax=Nocardia blacklockiae TaxID=480036 RepID=UPI0018951580|nr:DUF6328 family protein [Nocardia blacklockiae]MBF6175715.1 hypothetical protein [Nocardia blacklockiae]
MTAAGAADSAPAGGDQAWNWQARHETRTERLDRNWSTLIQETRVVQTGVQLLTGFLLTLPFQAKFDDLLSRPMRWLYLATVAASIAATVFLVAPVAAHRILFRRHRLGRAVAAAHRFALTGLALLGMALTGVAVLIFDAVAGAVAGVVAGTAFALLFVLVWVAHPWHQRRQTGPSGQQP